jgi:hypothetical protein
MSVSHTMKNGCGNIPHQKSLKTQRLSTEKTAMSALGCQKLGRGQGRFFPRAFRGFLAFPIPWFWLVNLPNCEKIHFHYFRHQSVVLCYGSSLLWSSHTPVLWLRTLASDQVHAGVISRSFQVLFLTLSSLLIHTYNIQMSPLHCHLDDE